MTEDSKAVVTRGCTAQKDETQYKCTTHTAGGQVSIVVCSHNSF